MPTKPEAVPLELAEFVGTALDLSELTRSGAQLNYPSALMPFEWACVRGLTRGRDRADTLKAERERAEAKLQAKKDKSR